MKTKVIAIAIGIIGVIVAWLGISTLLYYGSFTGTAEGVVVSREGDDLFIRFHEERDSPAPHFSGDAAYSFPLNDRTESLKVGDKVEAYYPPGKLTEALLDRDFSYFWPGTLMAIGAILVVAFGWMFIVSSRKHESAAH